MSTPTIEKIPDTSFLILSDTATASFLNWEWYIKDHKEDSLQLYCHSSHFTTWSLDVIIKLTLFEIDGTEKISKQYDVTYDQRRYTYALDGVIPQDATLVDYCKDNQLTYKCFVELKTVLELEYPLNNFESPLTVNDVILTVCGKELYVDKQMLSHHSPVLKTILDSNSKLDDVDFKEFELLLQVLYGFEEVNGRSGMDLWELAIRFKIEFLKIKCGNFYARNINRVKNDENGPYVHHNFDTRDDYNNTALHVGDKKLYINKQRLSTFSPFFAKMFESSSKKKNGAKYSVKNTTHIEMLWWLKIVYGCDEVDDWSFNFTLNLNERLGSKLVNSKCERFLLVNSTQSRINKLVFADMFKLPTLLKHSLEDIKKSDIESIKPDAFPILSGQTMKELLYIIARIID